MTDSFTHLHVHTEYSLLDGAAKLKPLVQAAARDGQPALAITDHGNLYGLVDFYKECSNQGVKPILGTEAYMARNSVDERPKKKSKKVDDGGGEDDRGEKVYHHLTLLAENNTGYQNLVQLGSRAFLEGFYHKPRVDWDILSDHAQGLVATSGCLGGIVLQELMHGRSEEALAAAGRLQDIFGRDSFFIELQDHGIPEQHQTNPELVRIARTLGAPLVATNDSHYTDHSDHAAHDALLCVQTNSKISDKDRFRFHGDQHYLKTANEMRHLFGDLPEACDNTLLIAERCDVKLDFDRILVPKFPVPEGEGTEEQYLRKLVAEGANGKVFNALRSDVANRIEYELEIICAMGFAGYFLIVWDLVRHAKSVGIRVGPARGSAGGSAVAYALGITEVDPLRWGLLFERFLNPSRVSMPDIDMDFDSRYRDHMINYCAKKYGDDRVAQIITFQQIRSRNAVKDASRVLGKPYSLGDKLSKALPKQIFGRDVPLAACLNYDERYEDGFNAASKFRAMYNADGDVREIVDVALGLEGLRKTNSVHAAAVVIAPDEITKYVPIQKKPKGPVVTQFEMHAIEELGLLKMDFLGLTTLDVITDAVQLIKKRHSIEIKTDELPLDDEATFELLRSGHTIGVFQLESTPMRALLRSLVPTTFDDIAAVLALYRPGPLAANMHLAYADRKNGRAPIEVFHPDAASMLEDTYGLMIYQEQLMDVAQHFAGYDLGDAYTLLKTCAKKLPEEMEKERAKFETGMAERGYGEEFATDLFDMVAEFANYAFNKSHSCGYGLISYTTAYLKANYPVEYMAALMTSVQSKHDKLSKFLSEAKRMGIEVVAPDINRSERNFFPLSDDQIIFGYLGLRNIGEPPAQAIVEEREVNGEYKDFFDYAKRVSKIALSKKVLDSLIGSGGFDSVGHPRKGLQQIHPEVVKDETRRKNIEATGQNTLFDMETNVAARGVPDLHYEQDELLALEKEYLGVYLSGHPLANIQDRLDRKIDYTIDEVNEMEEEQWEKMVLGGLVTDVVERTTKKGDLMKTFTLEDMSGSIACVLFPKQTVKWGHLVVNDNVILIEGRPEEDRGGAPKILIDNLQLFRRAFVRSNNVHVSLPDDYPMDLIRKQVIQSSGEGRVTVHYMGRSLLLPEEYTSSPDGLITEIASAVP